MPVLYRAYQQLAAELARALERLNVQLPTGYGKTLAAALCYAVKQSTGAANRLLLIVPRTAQLDQLLTDFKDELRAAGVSGPLEVTDLSESGVRALRRHRAATCQIFVVTIQALTTGRGAWDTVQELMADSAWMVAVDEYHHYGFGKAWSERVRRLPAAFFLALSATPHRPGEDSAFGAPDLQCTYRAAWQEGAVKRLKGGSYTYSVEIERDGESRTYTTRELLALIGTDDPDAIEAAMIAKRMRWSPKFIAPLVDRPIQRLIRTRARLGLPCQMLVKALCCTHARLVCEQIAETYPELRVDWVGTGEYGRSDVENADVLKRFCPPKRNGWKQPTDITLDVLVNVGMASEGMNTVYVTEAVLLTPANGTNQDHQFVGRASRTFPAECGIPVSEQEANVSFDSTSHYAAFTGDRIMDALDGLPAGDPGETTEDDDPRREPEPLPEDPGIRIIDVSCIEVDEGEVERMRQAVFAVVEHHRLLPTAGLNELRGALKDPQDPLQAAVEDMYRRLRQREADRFNDRSIREQWSHKIEGAVASLTGLVVLRLGLVDAKDLARARGQIKTRINTKKKDMFGHKRDLEPPQLMASYHWLRELLEEVRAHGVPGWLSRR